MPKTFLDAGVLIAATRGAGMDGERAVQVLEDPNRTFVASPFLYLELVPKAVFHRRQLEKDFYERYFAAAEFSRDLDQIVRIASSEAERAGLGAMDALHLAAAHLGGCEEFVTTEKQTATIHRSKLVPVVYLFD